MRGSKLVRGSFSEQSRKPRGKFHTRTNGREKSFNWTNGFDRTGSCKFPCFLRQTEKFLIKRKSWITSAIEQWMLNSAWTRTSEPAVGLPASESSGFRCALDFSCITWLRHSGNCLLGIREMGVPRSRKNSFTELMLTVKKLVFPEEMRALWLTMNKFRPISYLFTVVERRKYRTNLYRSSRFSPSNHKATWSG